MAGNLSLGLILDIGHRGKPQADSGATHVHAGRKRVEADLVTTYLDEAEDYAVGRGVVVHFIRPGMAGATYSARHREAVQVAQASRDRRWLYVQGHLNSTAGADPAYGLVGYDPRSAGGGAAAAHIARQLEAQARQVIRSARAEAAEGPWTRMMTTISGIYAGPSNLSGICYEPCFIQAANLEAALVDIAHALVDGALAWAAAGGR